MINVGDIVTIKSDISLYADYQGYWVTKEMYEGRGKKYRIDRVESMTSAIHGSVNIYQLEGFDDVWFTPRMLDNNNDSIDLHNEINVLDFLG